MTAVKSQPRQLCGRSTVGDTLSSWPHPATGVHMSHHLGLLLEIKDKITSWHYRSGKIKISARKNIQFGDCGRTKKGRNSLGAKADTPITGGQCVVAFSGSPVDTQCPPSDQTGTAERPADHARGLAVNRKGPSAAERFTQDFLNLCFPLV